MPKSDPLMAVIITGYFAKVHFSQKRSCVCELYTQINTLYPSDQQFHVVCSRSAVTNTEMRRSNIGCTVTFMLKLELQCGWKKKKSLFCLQSLAMSVPFCQVLCGGWLTELPAVAMQTGDNSSRDTVSLSTILLCGNSLSSRAPGRSA